MKRVCAWCGRELEPGQGGQNAPISHGICLSCMRRMLKERSSSLPVFLETLDAPVIVVDAEAVVLEANSRAHTLLGKDRMQVTGRRSGEIIECAGSLS
jgi:transcriptional regulator with PAS, ATPase and Fis domain